METARQKAIDFVEMNIDHDEHGPVIDALERLLKEQDRDTRHACAHEVAKLTRELDHNRIHYLVDFDEAYAACMNARAV